MKPARRELQGHTPLPLFSIFGFDSGILFICLVTPPGIIFLCISFLCSVLFVSRLCISNKTTYAYLFWLHSSFGKLLNPSSSFHCMYSILSIVHVLPMHPSRLDCIWHVTLFNVSETRLDVILCMGRSAIQLLVCASVNLSLLTHL